MLKAGKCQLPIALKGKSIEVEQRGSAEDQQMAQAEGDSLPRESSSLDEQSHKSVKPLWVSAVACNMIVLPATYIWRLAMLYTDMLWARQVLLQGQSMRLWSI